MDEANPIKISQKSLWVTISHDVIYRLQDNKNDKMARLLTFKNNLLYNIYNFVKCVETWCGDKVILTLLEFCMNAQEYIKRKKIIRLFNRCAKLCFSQKDNIVFMQLVCQYDFTDGDELNYYMKNIVVL